MDSFSGIFKKICWGFVIAISLTACTDTSNNDMPAEPGIPGSYVKVANSFDFSTVQKVDLNVDYNSVKTYGPVFFRIFTENPFITQDDETDVKWNEEVKPIYEDYTDENGKFNAVVELPSYAQHLYIATDNFYTGMSLLEGDVTDGNASVVAENYQIIPAPETTPANRKTSTNDVYVFDDSWPFKGDYDFSDVVVDAKHEIEFNTEGKIIKETFYLTTYQNYVELTNGLALTLDTKVTPENVGMKKIAPGSTDAVGTSFTKVGKVYYLTDDVKREIGSTYILELTYNTPLELSSQMASIQPFIYRSEGIVNWELHIPMEAPTARMNTSYFGQNDDCSDPIHKLYFVRQGNYPFALYLKGADINIFKETILKRENESIPIDQFFPGFLDWSVSGGDSSQDWYLMPNNL